jgi:hypothetical protein
MTIPRRLALTRALAGDLAVALDLDLDLDLAVALALDLDLALARGRDLARALARDVALDRDRDRDRDPARDLARALALDRDRALARDRAHALDLDRVLALARARVLARVLALDRALAAIASEHARHELPDRVAELHAGRALAVWLVLMLSIHDQATGGTRFGRQEIWDWLMRWRWRAHERILTSSRMEIIQNAAWDLHMAARLADARVSGADPPFEALRLVRERANTSRNGEQDRTAAVGLDIHVVPKADASAPRDV